MTPEQTPHHVRNPRVAGMPARRTEPGEEAAARGISPIGLPDALARKVPVVPGPFPAGLHAVEFGSGLGVYTQGGGPGIQADAASGTFTVPGRAAHPALVSVMCRACTVYGNASGFFTVLLVDGRVIDSASYLTPFTADQGASGSATAVIMLAPGAHDLRLSVSPFWDSTGTVEYVGYIAVVDLGIR